MRIDKTGEALYPQGADTFCVDSKRVRCKEKCLETVALLKYKKGQERGEGGLLDISRKASLKEWGLLKAQYYTPCVFSHVQSLDFKKRYQQKWEYLGIVGERRGQ